MSGRVVQVSLKPATFDEVRAAAKQTQLPISSYIEEVIEADLASRRMANPAGARTVCDTSPSPERSYHIHFPGNRRLFGI